MAWINGDIFAILKREGLLFGPFTGNLPNFRRVDTVNKPTTLVDFSLPTEGFEYPWGMAQLTFFADATALPQPPHWLCFGASLGLNWRRALGSKNFGPCFFCQC